MSIKWGGVTGVVMAVLAILILDAFLLDVSGLGNTCTVDRYDVKMPKPLGFLNSGLLLKITPWLILGCSLCIALRGRRSYKGKTFSLVPGLYVVITVVWYFMMYDILMMLKEAFGDTRCNKVANSVSGHFHAFVFILVMLPCLASPQPLWPMFSVSSRSIKEYLKGKKGRLMCVFSWLYACLLLVSIGILTSTYFHGYHTLRQIYLGVALAIINIDLLHHAFRWQGWNGFACADCEPYKLLSLVISLYLVTHIIMMYYTGRTLTGHRF